MQKYLYFCALMRDYIDIHTHNFIKKNVKQIINILYSVDQISTIYNTNYYSIGLHPWHIKKNINIVSPLSELVIKHKTIIAIGETGIDRACTTPINLQEEIFKQHIQVSEDLKKPLIIHSVRSYSDILRYHKLYKPKMPWILHNYNGNEVITKQYLKYNIYFSIGEIRKGSKLNKSIKIIPIEKLFFETDDSKTSIEEIYHNVSEILNTTTKNLIQIVSQNFNRVFIYE